MRNAVHRRKTSYFKYQCAQSILQIVHTVLVCIFLRITQLMGRNNSLVSFGPPPQGPVSITERSSLDMSHPLAVNRRASTCHRTRPHSSQGERHHRRGSRDPGACGGRSLLQLARGWSLLLVGPLERLVIVQRLLGESILLLGVTGWTSAHTVRSILHAFIVGLR